MGGRGGKAEGLLSQQSRLLWLLPAPLQQPGQGSSTTLVSWPTVANQVEQCSNSMSLQHLSSLKHLESIQATARDPAPSTSTSSILLDRFLQDVLVYPPHSDQDHGWLNKFNQNQLALSDLTLSPSDFTMTHSQCVYMALALTAVIDYDWRT